LVSEVGKLNKAVIIMVYKYIISLLFLLIILRIIYLNIKEYKQNNLKAESIIVSVLMVLFFIYMVYERLT